MRDFFFEIFINFNQLIHKIFCIMKIKHIITALTLALSLSINITAQSPATGTINGHKYVDLGLSVKWATCNIGASKPEDYSDYFAWGEDETKSTYTQDNSSTYGKTYYTFRDAAKTKWGGSWRMPTADECRELIDNCTWEFTTLGEREGYKVTNKKNGNSIFLPAAGDYDETGLVQAGEWGDYWSSSPDDRNDFAYCLLFIDDICVQYDWCYFGKSIRPVAE